MWAILRVENEHVSNTLGWRNNRFVPLHFTAAEQTRTRKSKTWKTVRLEMILVTLLVIIIAVLAVVHTAFGGLE